MRTPGTGRLRSPTVRGNHERRRALDHVGVERRQEVATLHATHCVEQLLRIGQVPQDDFAAGIRMGQFIAEDIVTVRLTPPFRLIFVASPAYLERVARPD